MRNRYTLLVDLYPVYFLTWPTYGTWLHGDPRGSVDDEHNIPGTDRLAPNAALLARRSAALRERPLILDPRSREIVHGAIESHAAHRSWTIHALNVRSNHVHVVVSASSHAPEVAAGQFKQWSTRRLREHGEFERHHVWARMASTRWINDERSLALAIEYVRHAQDAPPPGFSLLSV